ncbi:hypothetical protein GCM10009665_78190 [Kitasatospora nipponensis]|uniref:Uncharacterized protein n=1 Tax=Kitasatospora nipponensis TaxID=258049 RepID=A0ABN1TB11_9ACTN
MELAAAHQAVLYFQLWRIRGDGGLDWTGAPEISWTVDRLRPWATIVEECRDRALPAAGAILAADDLVTMLSWIGPCDL